MYVLKSDDGYLSKTTNKKFTLTLLLNRANKYYSISEAQTYIKKVPLKLTSSSWVIIPEQEAEPILNADKGNVDVETLVESTKVLLNFLKNTDNDVLNAKLQKCDLVFSDLYHFAENEKFNARDGFKGFKALGDVSRTRREIKIQQQIINILDNLHKYKNNKSSLDDNLNKLKIESENNYSPRVLVDLFNTKKFQEIDTYIK